MLYGKIFANTFSKDPKNLTLTEIENIAIKKVKFGHYGNNISPKQGNIFPRKKIDINKMVDTYLENLLAKNISLH